MDISTRPSYVESSTEEAINSARNFIHGCRALVSHLPAHERLIQPVITPRFVPTCTTDLLSRLGYLAMETSTMVQSHMAEAKDQLEWVKQNHGADDIDIFAKVLSSHHWRPRNSLANRLYLERSAYRKNNSSTLYFSSFLIIKSSPFFRHSYCPLSPFEFLFLLKTTCLTRGLG